MNDNQLIVKWSLGASLTLYWNSCAIEYCNFDKKKSFLPNTKTFLGVKRQELKLFRKLLIDIGILMIWICCHTPLL